MVRKFMALAVLGVIVVSLGRVAIDGGHLHYAPGMAPGYHWGRDTICPSQQVCAAQWRRELARQRPAASASVPQGGGSGLTAGTGRDRRRPDAWVHIGRHGVRAGVSVPVAPHVRAGISRRLGRW